jgi:predicted HAD superfamily Cof-like phosphohydrolase
MLKEGLEMVREFHDKYGIKFAEDITIPSKKEMELRLNLIEEEVKELQEAIAKEDVDIVEVSDALSDIQYVLFGAVNSFGLHDIFEDLFKEVHRSNMTKSNEKREDGKILKGDSFEQPNLVDVIKKSRMTPFDYSRPEKRPPIVAFDFDGVIAKYDGWDGEDNFGRPNAEILKLALTLNAMGAKIIIWTTRRDTKKLREYLDAIRFPYDSINCTKHNPPYSSSKPIYDVLIDDRAIGYDMTVGMRAIDYRRIEKLVAEKV